MAKLKAERIADILTAIDQEKIKRILIESFEAINTAIIDINAKRSLSEVIVDFFKSAANTIMYLLSLTTYSGFFNTTAQPLQEIKASLRKVNQLIDEFENIESPQSTFCFA